jgi:hypothetical protein
MVLTINQVGLLLIDQLETIRGMLKMQTVVPIQLQETLTEVHQTHRLALVMFRVMVDQMVQ